MKHKEGDIVILAPFEDQPRQRGIVIGVPEIDNDPYMIEVEPEDMYDDGLREVPEEQIEVE